MSRLTEADRGRDEQIRRSERLCWLCGARQPLAGIEPCESWDWSETRPDTHDDGPLCPSCMEENR